MSIKTGSQAYEFAGNEKVKILCESRASVFEVDENGEAKRFVLSGSNQLHFRTREPFRGYISVPEGEHWSIEVAEMPSPNDKADPRPFEIPEEMKKDLTLEDKLKAFVADMVAERYGKDSEEMDTFEDAMDFDMDDEETAPLSGFEVKEMQDVEPENMEPVGPETPVEEPKPEEKPEEPQPPPENG